MSSPRLLDPVHDRLRVKHYSMRTEGGKKHPREMGGLQVDLLWWE